MNDKKLVTQLTGIGLQTLQQAIFDNEFSHMPVKFNFDCWLKLKCISTDVLTFKYFLVSSNTDNAN